MAFWVFDLMRGVSTFSGGGITWCAIAILALLPNAHAAWAQAVRTRVLGGTETRRLASSPDRWLLRVRFQIPVRYVRHSPLERGSLLQIDIEPLAVAPDDAGQLLRRESLRAPGGPGFGLRELSYEGDDATPMLILRFEREVQFEVRQGADYRSLEILVVAPERPKPAARQKESGKLLAEARRAMTLGEATRAVALFGVVLEDPTASDADRQDALELLGLARERNGQLAHARAEYERYLEEYPRGDGADRVRQRLRAIDTAEARPRRPLLKAPARQEPPAGFEIYGSVAAAYLHARSFFDDRIEPVYDSTAFADLNLGADYERGPYELRGILSASYRYDFLASQTANDARVGTALVELRDRRGWSGTIGRQARSNGGVLGRFDGVRLAAEVADRVEVSALVGFPLETTTTGRFAVDRQLVGAAVDIDEIVRGLDAQLFAVARRDDGLLERVGVGGELRYVGANYFGLAFLDVDAYLGSLNTLLMTGTYRFAPGASLHAQVETRNSPILTLQNALQGQLAADLGELHEIYSSSEIQELARDRTARWYRASVGGSNALTPNLQVGADFSVAHLEGTPESEGVPGTDGTGAEFAGGLNLTRSDLFVRGGIGSVGLHGYIGDLFDSFGARVTGRFPITRMLAIQPRLFGNYRRHKQGGADVLTVRPTLRIGLRSHGFSVDAEAGLDWSNSFGGDLGNDISALAEIVVRYDF